MSNQHGQPSQWPQPSGQPPNWYPPNQGWVSPQQPRGQPPQPQRPEQWQRAVPPNNQYQPQQPNTPYQPQWQPRSQYSQQPYQSPPTYYPQQQYYQPMPPPMMPPPPPKKKHTAWIVIGVIIGILTLSGLIGNAVNPQSSTTTTVTTSNVQPTDTPTPTPTPLTSRDAIAKQVQVDITNAQLRGDDIQAGYGAKDNAFALIGLNPPLAMTPGEQLALVQNDCFDGQKAIWQDPLLQIESQNLHLGKHWPSHFVWCITSIPIPQTGFCNSDEDLEMFREAWREMLKTQFW